jgi:Tfp pilus assembly protein PilV
MICPQRQKAARAHLKSKDKERGFTLIEITIALVIMMVVMLGAASLFAFATLNNSNGADRAQTLAVAQETMETLRRLRFSTAGTDPELSRATYTQTVYRGQAGASGRQYTINVTIVDTTPTVKTITVNVTPVAAQNAWTSNTSWATVSLVTQRAMSDQP